MAKPRPPQTIGESLYWSYANLGMMLGVLRDKVPGPTQIHFIIRSRLYAGLRKGSMNVRVFFEDERFKLKVPARCWYCGGDERLSADHIVPRSKGGTDGGENLIYSCRRCNSSKGSKDLLEWMARRGQFPPLYLLIRYLKMAILYCRTNNLMDVPLSQAGRLKDNLPFALDLIPQNSHRPASCANGSQRIARARETRLPPCNDLLDRRAAVADVWLVL